MYKVGDLFILKEGELAMKVKAVTNDGKKIRTFRAIKGEMWIPVSSTRRANDEERKLFIKAMKEIKNVRSV